jgi:hypothetical protein
MVTLRSLPRTALNLLRFPFDARRFRSTGQTEPQAYQAMVQLFCATGGRFNDWISGLIRIHSRPLQLPSPVGVLGDLRDGRLQAHADTLRDRGYVVFPRALSDELCDRLMSFARETPALVRRMDDDPDDLSPRLALYDPDEPLAVRYDYPVDALLDNPTCSHCWRTRRCCRWRSVTWAAGRVPTSCRCGGTRPITTSPTALPRSSITSTSTGSSGSRSSST